MAEPLQEFVARRRPDWDALRNLLDAQRAGRLHLADLEVLDRLYRRAAADLAQAQASYPNTDAHRFLNQLVGSAYRAIYRPSGDRLAATKDFFRRGFPRAVRAERRFVAVSALLLVLGLVLGAGVVWFEPRGAELLVPQPMRDSVATGRLWTDEVLSVAPPGVLASGILTNNLTVTIALFALGATLGVGTALVLLNNGIHIGAITAFVFREGMGPDLLAFMSAHGPLELSLIVIAGAAGLMIGQAFIDPGEQPRMAHARRRAAEAAKLVVGSAPFLALVGIVEGYVSPGAFFPAAVRATLGLLLVAAFWSYIAFVGRDD